MSKPFWKSKTVWVNVLTVVAGTFAYVAGNELVADNASFVAILVTLQGGVNVVLRLVTSVPIE